MLQDSNRRDHKAVVDFPGVAVKFILKEIGTTVS